MTLQDSPYRKDALYRYTLLLLFLFLLFGGLYFARAFFVPFTLAALLAMLMLPVSRRFEKWGLPRGVAVALCILMLLIILAGLIALFTSQVVSLGNDAPQLKAQLLDKYERVQVFIESQTNITAEKQSVFAKERLGKFLESADTMVRNFLTSLTGALATLGLMVIYIFFFMYYRDKFQRFVLRITPAVEHDKALAVTEGTTKVAQQYLSGMLMVIVILSVLNSVGLLIIGLKQAIFFGCLAAILNVIPYIGVLIGSLFPILMALLTKDSFGAVVAVAAVFAFNQFLENNFLTPNIVGGQVKVNPLATIVALIIGGLLWGVAGMVLFIPLLGILKVIFDHVEPLKPYGYLIGEEGTPSSGKQGRLLDKVKGWFGIKSRVATAE